MEPVRNHRNRVVMEAARLHRARRRRETRLTLLEGPALVEDALRSGCRAQSLFAIPDDVRGRELAEEHGLELVLVDQRAMSRVAGTDTPRGPVALVEIPEEELDPGRDVLVSWGVSDPGNVGTLIRTAASFGWGYVYTEGSADPWAPKSLRSGAGGQFQTRVKAIAGLDDLASWHTIATVVGAGDPPGSVKADRVALLIGEEASGLPCDVVESCDDRVTISTPGQTESLNAAIAAGILVYELSNRSGQPGRAV